MKFLFVSGFFDGEICGAYWCTHAHFEILRNVLPTWEWTIVSTISRKTIERPEPGKISLRCIRTIYDSVINRLHGKTSDYSNEAEQRILSLVKNGGYDLVWFDESKYGSTVRAIKQMMPELPVYVFYHTVDNDIKGAIRKNIFKLKGALKILHFVNGMKQQELSARYADVNMTISERDGTAFSKLYGFEAQLFFPTVYVDKAHIAPLERTPDEFNILFVGGGIHQPNVDGIKWFAKNVMPGLDERARLFIVGNGMDKWKDEPEFKGNPRIKITGLVESLDPYYNMADIAIGPIFYGAGMMSKMVEALMYGKDILATSHALNGFPDVLNRCICDTAEEFITRINAMVESGVKRYNPDMRKIFENNYSIDAMGKILSQSLSERGVI